MQRILFITATRIGDAVINSGVLDYLVKTYPDARITIACGPLAQPVLENTPGLERIIIMRKKSFGLHWLGLWRRVFPKQWDLVIDMRGSAISAFLRCKRRRVNKSTKVVMHKVKEAAGVLQLDPAPAPKIYLPAGARERALAWMPADRDWLVVCPSASWPFKMWPADRFANLVQKLTGANGAMADAGVVVVGGPGDEDYARPIVEALPPDRVVDLTGKLYLSDVAAVTERARLFIGNDSGVMHMSAAMNTATLGLFGPSDELLYGPYGEKCVSVRGPRGVREIQKAYPKWKEHPTSLLDDLTVESVIEAAERLLERTRDDANL